MDDDAEISTVAFEESMVRIHEDLGMEVPDWLRH